MKDGIKEKSEYLGARISSAAKAKLIKLAKEERRSASKQIEVMILNYNKQ